MSVALDLLTLFRGRADYTAVADGAGFHPEPFATTADHIERHVRQQQCYGFYLLTSDGKVFCTCVDFDNKADRPDPRWKEKAESVYLRLVNLGLTPLVEISQSGEGCHVWLFFSEAVDAWLARAWWRVVASQVGFSFTEVYPRQDRHVGKGLGNLVRYPLWNKSYFADVEDEWHGIEAEDAIRTVGKTDAGSLRLLAWELGVAELKPESPLTEEAGEGKEISGISQRVRDRLAKPHTLAARRWFGDTSGMQDTSRSSLVLSIACELVRTYVPTPEIEQAIRYWCDHNGYEKGQRDGWVRDTVRKAYDYVLTRTEAKSTAASTLKDAALAYLDRVASGSPMKVSTGIHELDRCIDGIGYGEVAIVAARPGHGKSAFGMQWMDAASAAGNKCLILSEEMSAFELGRRSILSLSEVDEPDWGVELARMKGDVLRHYEGREPIYVQENCGTIDRAEEVIDQYCGIYGVSLVAVDYLQLIGSRKGSRYEDVTDVSRRLKLAAARNNCAMLLMCQLNREIEKRDKFVPKNSDLRESGQIEQDADLIVFVQWPIKFDATYSNPDEYRIYVTKRRSGAIKDNGVITTTFNPNRQRIGMFSGVEQWSY